MAEAKLVGDGAAGGQVIMSAAARAVLLAGTGQGSKARAAAAGGGYCLIHMGRHVLVRRWGCDIEWQGAVCAGTSVCIACGNAAG